MIDSMKNFIELFDKGEVEEFLEDFKSLSGVAMFLNMLMFAYTSNKDYQTYQKVFRDSAARTLLLFFHIFKDDVAAKCYDGADFHGVNLEDMDGKSIYMWLNTINACFENRTFFIPVMLEDNHVTMVSLVDYLSELFGDNPKYKDYIESFILLFFSVGSGLFREIDVYSLYSMNPKLFSVVPVGWKC